MSTLDWIAAELDALRREQRLRQRVECQQIDAVTIEVQGQRYVHFASNDYLGLSTDPRLVAAANRVAAESGWGSGASPLLTGRSPAHAQLEQALAAWEATEAALLFSSGYAANVGAITALCGPGDTIFSDAKNHASIIDGCRLSRAEVRVYRHGDVDHLADLLSLTPGEGGRLIVTDSLFSMDGDCAPLPQLVELARAHHAMLMVDEAHATGVFGQRGTGLAEAQGVADAIDIKVGTLSKALGSVGGFVAGTRPLIDLLANRARSYIFSTSMPAAVCGAAHAALQIVRDEPDRRERLLQRSAELRATLAAQGWDVGTTTSQIIPLIVGDEQSALEVAAQLRERGLWLPAIRPPSVARGESRLRLSLSYAHSDAVIARLVESLEGLVTHVANRAAKL